MNKKQKFETFLESLKGRGQDTLIESVKKGFQACVEMNESYYGDEGGNIRFAGPGSALRASTKRNPRNLPCPTCGTPNRLTPADAARGYQCDSCANRDEGGGW